MALVHQFLASLRRDEEGQGLAEYALILALIAIVAIIALIFLGGQVSKILSTVGTGPGLGPTPNPRPVGAGRLGKLVFRRWCAHAHIGPFDLLTANRRTLCWVGPDNASGLH